MFLLFRKFIYLFCLYCIISTQLYAIPTKKELYPHWNLNNSEQLKKLTAIHSFINKHKDKDQIAVFDWDGTLYNQDIYINEKVGGNVYRAGQPVWHIWAANHYNKSDLVSLNLFPMYRNNNNNPLYDLILKDNYLEDKIKHPKLDHYEKFSQIACLEAGMTPENMVQGILKFLEKYPVKKHVFLSMFDVLQQMINNSFKVWIVTGSNPYLVAVLLSKIEEIHPMYDFRKLANKKYKPSSKDGSKIYSRIIGNFAKTSNGIFNNVYDDRFMPHKKYKKLYVSAAIGKELTVKDYIEKFDGPGRAVFCAGNSGGDYEMMQYILNNSKETFGILVNPSGTLKEFKNRNNVQTLTLPLSQ